MKTTEELKEFLGVDRLGEVSDGYHTFDELYYHRAVLFSVICNQNKELAWKSKLHSDGTMYDGMFIVGINTKVGQYTYHYDLNLWSMFNVKELDKAPIYDGHLPKDIERLKSLDTKNSLGYKIMCENQKNIIKELKCENEKIKKDLIEHEKITKKLKNKNKKLKKQIKKESDKYMEFLKLISVIIPKQYKSEYIIPKINPSQNNFKE